MLSIYRLFQTMIRLTIIFLLNSGIDEPLLYCFKSYLSDRTRQIKTYDIYSDIKVFSSGISQGAILSLLLFSFIVNGASSFPLH